MLGWVGWIEGSQDSFMGAYFCYLRTRTQGAGPRSEAVTGHCLLPETGQNQWHSATDIKICSSFLWKLSQRSIASCCIPLEEQITDSICQISSFEPHNRNQQWWGFAQEKGWGPSHPCLSPHWCSQTEYCPAPVPMSSFLMQGILPISQSHLWQWVFPAHPPGEMPKASWSQSLDCLYGWAISPYRPCFPPSLCSCPSCMPFSFLCWVFQCNTLSKYILLYSLLFC